MRLMFNFSLAGRIALLPEPWHLVLSRLPGVPSRLSECFCREHTLFIGGVNTCRV